MYSIALHSISNAVPIVCLIRVSILVYLSTGKLDVELAVFLSVSTLFLRQFLSLNTELSYLVRLVDQQAPVYSLLSRCWH